MTLQRAVLMVVLSSCAPIAEEVSRAEAQLRAATVVEGPTLGMFGQTSSQALALQKILASAEHAERFERLIASGSLPAIIYGLCGLALTDRAAFLIAVEPFRAPKKGVALFTADIMIQHYEVAEMLEPTSVQAKPGSLPFEQFTLFCTSLRTVK